MFLPIKLLPKSKKVLRFPVFAVELFMYVKDQTLTIMPIVILDIAKGKLTAPHTTQALCLIMTPIRATESPCGPCHRQDVVLIQQFV